VSGLSGHRTKATGRHEGRPASAIGCGLRRSRDQKDWQEPLLQKLGKGHTLPQAPQLLLSNAVFVHALRPPLNGHEVRGDGHCEHMPLLHSCPAAHLRPHPPQLVGSNVVFTQMLNPFTVHAVRSSGHTTLVHAPLKQL
jgi:hypothetical protein